MENHLEWTSPPALWRGEIDFADGEIRRGFRTPAIFRFTSDEFMPEFLNVLNVDPARLADYVALPETWDSPPGSIAPPVQTTGRRLKLERLRAAAVRRLESRGIMAFTQLAVSRAGKPKAFKLFQPAHQRYYLVASSLVCRNVGLPDHKIDTSAQEKVSFVIRMLHPRPGAAAINPDPRDCDELALVENAWSVVSNPETMPQGEKVYAMSPVTYLGDDQRRRRLLVSLVPVGQREALLAASQPPRQDDGVRPPVIDTRQMLLKTKLIEPWHQLEEVAKRTTLGATNPPPATIAEVLIADTTIATANDQIQSISWYILLDFAQWLQETVGHLWTAIDSGDPSDLGSDEQTVYTLLNNTSFSGTSFRLALKEIGQSRDSLEKAATRFSSLSPAGWPSLRFRFATASRIVATGLTPDLSRATLEDALVKLLPVDPGKPQPPVRLTAQTRSNPNAPVWFSIRCVFERPNCSTFSPALLSDPTAAFQLAAFFDPDAPARPIRIGLPIDTSPAGLRKFDKNTAFVMSDVLCGQVSKMSSVSFMDLVLSVLPFPFKQGLNVGDMKPCAEGSPEISLGMVCSISIPIITICAIIVLMIMVKLLDMIFNWMPFFILCLPIPKFSAKEQ